MFRFSTQLYSLHFSFSLNVWSRFRSTLFTNSAIIKEIFLYMGWNITLLSDCDWSWLKHSKFRLGMLSCNYCTLNNSCKAKLLLNYLQLWACQEFTEMIAQDKLICLNVFKLHYLILKTKAQVWPSLSKSGSKRIMALVRQKLSVLLCCTSPSTQTYPQ